MLREEIKHIASTRKDLQSFGLVVGGVISVIGIYLWYNNSELFPYFLGLGGGLILSGLAAPALLKPLQRAWMILAVILGFIMTRVILTLLYYVVFTTVGWIAKLTGKQFLDQRWQPGRAESYWHYREKKSLDKTGYEKQF